MTDALKPCPFCGGEATRDHWAQKYMECKSCGIYGPDCIWPDNAENAWNTRADTATPARAPAVDPMSDPRVVALVDALREVLSDLEIGAHPHLHIEQIRAALAAITATDEG